MASIQAEPQLTLVDEKVNITLRGLEPGSKVTLRSQLDEMKMKFESHAHYQADEKGELSLVNSNSTGGSFTGKFACDTCVVCMWYLWAQLEKMQIS